MSHITGMSSAAVVKLSPGFQGFVASYPRSGSAMVRIALAHCYGEKTGSIYNETLLPGDFRAAVNASDDCEGWIKTHERASRGGVLGRAIIVVRHPGSVFRSLQKFYRERNDLEVSFEELVDGRHPWGDWSTWVRSWAVHAPPGALWVRYEDFKPVDLAPAIGRGPDPGSPDPRSLLPDLSRDMPTLFGDGDVRPSWPVGYRERIQERHGAVMSMLGYRREPAA